MRHTHPLIRTHSRNTFKFKYSHECDGIKNSQSLSLQSGFYCCALNEKVFFQSGFTNWNVINRSLKYNENKNEISSQISIVMSFNFYAIVNSIGESFNFDINFNFPNKSQSGLGLLGGLTLQQVLCVSCEIFGFYR